MAVNITEFQQYGTTTGQVFNIYIYIVDVTQAIKHTNTEISHTSAAEHVVCPVDGCCAAPDLCLLFFNTALFTHIAADFS